MNNRARRSTGIKPFVPGGVYNPNAPIKPVIQEVLVLPAPVRGGPAPSLLQQLQPLPQPQLLMKVDKPTQAQTNDALVLPISKIVRLECHDDECHDVGTSIDVAIADENGGKIPFKKIFQKRKKSSERTRDKKLRQNRQLRKSMLPKNALMALNEVKGITISDFTINSNPDGGFTAIVTVNSHQYEGKGNSKMAAKNQACEKALRDFIIAKMTPRPKKNTGEQREDGEMEQESDGLDSPEDEVPMLNLASFAIYKLFAEWEREGYVVPEMHPSGGGAAASSENPLSPSGKEGKEQKKPSMRSELPCNWESMHPATLLCIMRPGLSYVDHGAYGDKPNVLQRLGVTVDGEEYIASGRSKKIARRNVAVSVCNTLFDTDFIYQEY
ncbi:double-stranded RNA-specific editase 1 isoform X2 [Drosophila busckii]|uniref:double-stranded RNA-specific editase 1 isoform X2 n=1 Tax=Drosophila busckii TaxID=30019 RepID=UPI00083EF5AF|nr:double-stranded RNA-specific editase 1 isoform X2 [Drosophila busckii]